MNIRKLTLMQSRQSATTPGILTLVKILIWVLQRKCSPDTGSICILYAKEATIVLLIKLPGP